MNLYYKASVFNFLMRHSCGVQTSQKRKRGASTLDDENNQLVTHYNLRGHPFGIFGVPDLLYDEFLTEYANSIESGAQLAFSEQRSPVFRYHLDLDIKYTRKLTRTEIMDMVRLIQKTVAKFYPSFNDADKNYHLTAIVTIPHGIKGVETTDQQDNPIDSVSTATSSPLVQEAQHVEPCSRVPYDDHCVDEICHAHVSTPLSACQTMTTMFTPSTTNTITTTTTQGSSINDAANVVKNGIHVHMPKLFVNASQALVIRESLLVDFTARYGQVFGHSSWKDIIDEAIYTRNGLRMTYSVKAMPCKTCRSNRNQSAFKCPHPQCVEGHVIGPCYKPLCIIHGCGEENEKGLQPLLNNVHLAVSLTSIRCRADAMVTRGFVIYPGAPMYVPEEKRAKQTDGASMFDRDERAAKRALKNMTKLTDSILIDEIERFIQQYTYAEYAQIQVHDVHYKFVNRKNNPLYYQVRVKQGCIGANYCMNVCRSHTSSTIYFYIDKFGISQRCWSYKGTCRTYKSEPKPLTQELILELFTKQSVQTFLENTASSVGLDTPEGRIQGALQAQMLLMARNAEIYREMDKRAVEKQQDCSDDENEVIKHAIQGSNTYLSAKKSTKKKKTASHVSAIVSSPAVSYSTISTTCSSTASTPLRK